MNLFNMIIDREDYLLSDNKNQYIIFNKTHLLLYFLFLLLIGVGILTSQIYLFFFLK